MTHVIYDEFSVNVGGAYACAGEVRYTFRVIPGRKAVTWANATGGFSPAEAATVEFDEVAIRTNAAHPWAKAEGILFDLLTADMSDGWFLEQVAEAAE